MDGLIKIDFVFYNNFKNDLNEFLNIIIVSVIKNLEVKVVVEYCFKELIIFFLKFLVFLFFM